MSATSAFAALLRDHGFDLLLGSTLVLGVAAVAVGATRSVVGRRRLLRCGLVAIASYLAVAAVPLPRWSPPRGSVAAEGHGGTAVVGPAARRAAGRVADEPAALPPTVSAVSSAVPARAATAPRSERLRSAPFDSAAVDPAIVAAWLLLGAGVTLTTQLALGWWRLRRILARSVAASAEQLAGIALPPRVEVRITDLAVQPFCCGIWRRRIVLPRALAAPSPAATFVLQHELAHLRHGDTRWRAFALLLRPLLFWQPLYWWLQARLRFHDELLADDVAARGDAGGYVRAMLALVSASPPNVVATATPAIFVFRRHTELFRRCEMILQRETGLSTSTSRWRRRLETAAAAALVGVCAATFGVERAVAQDPGAVAELRQQIDVLLHENDALRAELATLRAQPGAGEAAVPPAAGTVNVGDEILRYTVVAGDSLDRIARKIYTEPGAVERLLALNPDLDPRQLRIGQELRLIVSGTGPAPRPTPPTATPRMSRSLEDVANVIARSIELRGAVQIAEVEVARAQERFESGRTSNYDVEIARIGLATKKRQLAAITGLLQRELDAAKDELAHVEALAEHGYATRREAAEISAFVQVLLGVF
ncbi:MAG: LysM peptidoglycan-binding domain-containing protein [Planctomycetes bacterium]|nr:LysM peptidoglycan-binding domain-containing protein [Planctomycetota bacterium]